MLQPAGTQLELALRKTGTKEGIADAEHKPSSRASVKKRISESHTVGNLGEFARKRIQGWLQDVMKEEVAELLGWGKSERRAAVDAPGAYSDGHTIGAK